MKKLIALLLAAIMMVGVLSVAYADDLEVLTEFGDLTIDDAEYDPNPDYDMWTVIEYYIESADATVIITCSAMEDFSELNLEYSFYGDDQQVICDAEGNVSFDKTGFMGNDTPDMVAYIIENAVWSAMPEEGDVIEFGDLTSEDAEYDPNPDYDKWTVIEYYIESADATVIITCSAKADDSEFNMEYSFYGDDQQVVCDAEGNVSFDKTGFMANDTPDMVSYIIENAVWADIAADDVISFGDLTSEDAEYDPNPDYDKWTVIEYYIESADATVIITCSAKADDSEFNMEYSFYGDDQQVVCDAEGNVSFDKTGFMANDTPDMVAYIIENAVWADIA